MPRGDYFKEKRKQKGKNKKNTGAGNTNYMGFPTLVLPTVIGKNRKDQR